MNIGYILKVLVTFVTFLTKVVYCNTHGPFATKQLLLFSQISSSENVELGQGSMFGYSTALLPSSNSSQASILIGAPQGNSTGTASHFHSPGIVWHCQISDKSECIQLSLPSIKSSVCGEKRCSWGDNAFYGSSIATDGQNLLVSAPHKKNLYGNRRLNGYTVLYPYITEGISNSSKSVGLQPLRDPKKQTVNGFPIYSWAQAGFSSYIRGREILLGAPGMNAWNGSVVRYDLQKKKEDFLVLNTLGVALYYEIEYIGYSVTRGNYFNSTSTRRWTATGAPRSSEVYGIVLVFNFPSPEEEDDWYPEKILEGDQFGAYYGYSVASADLNGDGLDELLVGAPFRRKNEDSYKEEGCLIVYTAKSRTQSFGYPEVLCGSDSAGARFGSTVASAGDVNGDGYNDLVVGAPFENENEGGIYIYYGSNLFGQDQSEPRKPSVIIRPRDLPRPNLKGFGSSLYGDVDIDDNGTPDLSVGAFLSDSVVILRTRKKFKFETKLQLIVNNTFMDEIPDNIDVMTLQSCLRVGNPPSEPIFSRNYTIKMKLSISSPYGFTRGKNMVKYDAKLQSADDTSCTDLEIAKNIVSNVINVTSLDIHWELKYSEVVHNFTGVTSFVLNPNNWSKNSTGEDIDIFCASCPQSEHLTGIYRFPILPATCEETEANCKSKFDIQLFFVSSGKPISKTWIIGDGSLSLVISVKNQGTRRRVPRIYVSISPELTSLELDNDRINTDCAFTNRNPVKLLCILPILAPTESVNFTVFSISSAYIKTRSVLMTINAFLDDKSPELVANTEINIKTDSHVKLEASRKNLQIRGKGLIEVQHLFFGAIVGKSGLEKLTIDFAFPIRYEGKELLQFSKPLPPECDKNKKTEPKRQISSRTLNCLVANVTCQAVTCEYNQLDRNTKFQLKFHFKLDQLAFSHVMKKFDENILLIESKVEVYALDDQPKLNFAYFIVRDDTMLGGTRSIRSALISGVFLGLVLLFLIVIILFRVGFFKRKKFQQKDEISTIWNYSMIYQPPTYRA